MAFPTVVNAQERSLTREKAAKVIERSEHMKAFGATGHHKFNDLELDTRGIREGEVSGFWKYQQAHPWETHFTGATGSPVTGFLVFTPKGLNEPIAIITQ